MNKNGRVPKRYFYRDLMISISEMMKIESCKYSRQQIQLMLNAGKSAEEIAHPDLFSKAEKRVIAKAARDQKAIDKAIIKAAQTEQKRLRAIEIMAVPMAEKATYVYYALKSYTHRSDSFMSEPIRLTNGGGY